ILFKRAVRFDVLGRKVSEDECVEVDKLVSKLLGRFARELEDSDVAVRVDRLPQKLLDKKSSWHGHFECIRAGMFADLKANCPEHCRLLAGGFKYRVEH